MELFSDTRATWFTCLDIYFVELCTFTLKNFTLKRSIVKHSIFYKRKNHVF